MGIAPYKYFTYDGESSRDYDVYLTGDGVFNAPERAVDMVEIPGRNGDYALDQGKFNNISVTYKAGIVDYSESDFANKVSAVRNWLCSKVGYKRLSDDYNPNEYRMAVYKSGVEIDHVDLKTGEFEITFDCKPQRWLTSGETATAVANNGTLSNPTLFDASPLLAVKGYGNISFNGYDISLENALIGNIVLVEDGHYNNGASITLDLSNANTGDDIIVDINRLPSYFSSRKTSSFTCSYVSDAIADSNSNFSTSFYNEKLSTSGGETWYRCTFFTGVEPLTFKKGTSNTISNTLSGTLTVSYNGNSNSVTISGTQSVAYDGSNTITINSTYIVSTGLPGTNGYYANAFNVDSIVVDSTVSAVTDTVYIDCDIGECWTVKNSEIVSLNSHIDLGSDLPVLASGTNTFTYDNTITSFKVTPNWWKV